ncbi:MAG: CocE/NonD family hydrolase, partial [Alphaproteobacteria bacterium]|nr:CocE/NonD family hydrolase [Alphaproteobacteria bacterium]
PDRAPLRLALGAGNRLAADATPMPPTIIASPQDCGLAGGEYCAIWLGPELPGDQRIDDEQSACFDSEPLDAPLDIVGAPVISLTLSANRPHAMVAVRLCDVQPDGASTRITYGVLNLCHRDSHQFPRNVVPGEPIQVVLQLDDIAYSVKPGNRLRVAISSTYWPLVWPSPEPVALTLAEGAIDLPVRPSGQGDEWSFAEPEAATPWKIETLRPSTNSRTVKRTADGRVRLDIVDDFGEVRDLDHGLVSGGTAEESWTIDPDDPLSAHGSTRWTQTLSRDGWSVSTETLTEMTSDATSFHLRGRIVAREGSRLVFERDFDETAPRGFI